jgi:hypothetical protein
MIIFGAPEYGIADSPRCLAESSADLFLNVHVDFAGCQVWRWTPIP